MKWFSRRQKEKKPRSGKARDNGALTFDLLYQLSYMSVIAAAGVPRNQIFERSSQLPTRCSQYFKKVEAAHKGLGYDYATACQAVGESIKEEQVKELLLRFSSSLVSGEPEAEFLAREAESLSRSFESAYERKLESLKLWTDAYVSLVLSAVLVMLMGMVSTMIWKIQTLFIVGLVVIAIASTALGIWLIYLMSPRETVVLSWAGSREQKLIHKLAKILLPLALILGALLWISGANIGLALLVIAALAFPIGFISVLDDKKVARRDAEISNFLRSLGGVCAAIGATVREALGRMDLNSLNHLQQQVKRLRTRLLSGVRAKLCWQKFVEETGSELVHRSVGMFYDAISVGGEPEQAGYHASLFASRLALLRARRKTVSLPFQWLCVVMHAATTVLLIFVTEVISIFAGMVGKAEQEMPKMSGGTSVGAFTSFSFSGLDLLQRLVLPLVLIFTVANALAPIIADGGSRWKIIYNLSLTSSISGASLVLLPKLAAMLFRSIQI